MMSLRRALPGEAVAYQQPKQALGSTTGVMPNATDNVANAIRITAAHTQKTMSEDFKRSCFVATGGYKIVGENKVISISKSFEPMTWSLEFHLYAQPEIGVTRSASHPPHALLTLSTRMLSRIEDVCGAVLIHSCWGWARDLRLGPP
jgi:hypothetical protein